MSDTTTRSADLRQMLGERRREIQDDVHSRIRDGRADSRNDVHDAVDASDAHIQKDIDMALLQMKAQTLVRIDAALAQLDAGKYGACFECEGEIPGRRLRALPFAVRCQACQERHEEGQQRGKRITQSRGSFSLFPELVGL